MPLTNPILYVEDSADDVLFMRTALRKADVANRLCTASDGQEAVDYLSGTGKFSDRNEFPLPGLLLLDLKMPRLTGMEVLAWIRQQPAFKLLPVIVVTSSAQQTDVVRAYELGANGFLVKPVGPAELTEMCRSIKQFWLTYNQSVSRAV
jgi:CheY-like chemotaxis protein